jgi:hypothetical protein
MVLEEGLKCALQYQLKEKTDKSYLFGHLQFSGRKLMIWKN